MSKYFGKINNVATVLYTISSADISVDIADYGATVTAIRVTNEHGVIDVALGHTSVQGQSVSEGYIGATIGRCGNRIDKGQFELGGTEYSLACNKGTSHLHGGECGFDKKIFVVDDIGDSYIQLSCSSVDKEEGYPANLSMSVRYSIEGGTLSIEYRAISDQDTLYNPTNHSYFNLAGEGNGTILDHVLTIHADRYMPVNDALIPTGQLADVGGTPFDYRLPTAIGDRIAQDNIQLQYGNGYDHNYCVDSGKIATLYCPRTNIAMDVYTDRCGVQLYTGNYLDEHGKSYYTRHSGVALETQCYPDNIHHHLGDSVVLTANSPYYSRTQYKFYIQKA